MIISSIFPVLEFAGFYGLKTFFRLLDRSFTSDSYKSKKKSINQYIDTYAGPEYQIHFRFSAIMNTCFVCFTYGAALPILFPIALLAFVVLYITERLLICYYYRQPPAFDEKMTMNTLRILQWAPMVYMLMSYWMLTNNQIFDNVVYPVEKVTDVLRSGHTIISDFKDLKYDQGFPLLIMGLTLLFMMPFGFIIMGIIGMVAPGVFGVHLNVDEDLANYFEALEMDDRNWMLKEEDNMR